jgi:hypothetical protein
MEKNYSVLQNQQVGETVRELGLAGQNEKGRNTYYGRFDHHFATLSSSIIVFKIT